MSQTNLSASGRFATEKASRYLQQLCKHFGHKTEVEFDSEKGRVTLAPGPVVMQATDSELQITVTGSDAEGIARAKSIIDSHLARFAFREEFTTMAWD